MRRFLAGVAVTLAIIVIFTALGMLPALITYWIVSHP